MRSKSPIAVLLLVTSVLAGGACATRTRVVYVSSAPPAAVREVITTAPGPGYVWVAGYHRWEGHAYVWVPGHWQVPPTHRRHWVAGHWAHDRHGWYWVEGHWR